MMTTTVNEILPKGAMPHSRNTSVNHYATNMEPHRHSVIADLMNPEIARSISLWSQRLHFIKDVGSSSDGIAEMLEAFCVSSSHLEVLNKIARIRTLISDWDEYFKAPSTETITNALKIAALFPKQFPVAKICLSSDGDVSFELIKGNKHAVIDIDEENEFGYAYLRGKTFVPGKEKGELPADKLPKDLVEYFSL